MIVDYHRRKFRSQTSDNMDRWKSRDGKNQRREEQKTEDQRRERVRRKKMQARKKIKVAKHYVFPVICDSGGSKSRLAKAAGAEPSGQIRDEKLHAFVARSVFRSHDGLGPLLEVETSETCTPLWREAHFEVKMRITARSEHL